MNKPYTHQGVCHFRSPETGHWKEHHIALRKTIKGWSSGRGDEECHFTSAGNGPNDSRLNLDTIQEL